MLLKKYRNRVLKRKRHVYHNPPPAFRDFQYFYLGINNISPAAKQIRCKQYTKRMAGTNARSILPVPCDKGWPRAVPASSCYQMG